MTIEEILRDRSVGRMQSVAQMQVIPILGGSDDAFAPPEIEVATTEYGRVRVQNVDARTTIVPPGSAWVVSRKWQDHAVGAGSLVPGKAVRSLNGMCVQQSQPGLIPMGRYPLQILPLGLRATALHLRNDEAYTRLWQPLADFQSVYGLKDSEGNLSRFLRAFAKELDEFVAEFEIVDDQVGAIVLIGGAVAGLELAPSTAYWSAVWTPLIRLCYGSRALYAQRMHPTAPPPTRTPLTVRDRTIAGLRKALAEADEAQAGVVRDVVASLADREVHSVPGGDSSVGPTVMRAVQGKNLIGQIVHTAVPTNAVKFASLVARSA